MRCTSLRISTGALQPYLYQITPAATAGAAPTLTLLNGGAPLNSGFSSDGQSVELAIPQTLLTPAGGAAPTAIDFSALINNGAVALPGDFTNNPEYIITDPATPPTRIGNLITLDGTFTDWPAAPRGRHCRDDRSGLFLPRHRPRRLGCADRRGLADPAYRRRQSRQRARDVSRPELRRRHQRPGGRGRQSRRLCRYGRWNTSHLGGRSRRGRVQDILQHRRNFP